MHTVVNGLDLRFLSTWVIPGGVVDCWEWPDRAPGETSRAGLVVTVRTGQEQAAEPFHGWGGVVAYAVVSTPADDPVERFQESMRQASKRHEDRESDAQFDQVVT